MDLDRNELNILYDAVLILDDFLVKKFTTESKYAIFDPKYLEALRGVRARIRSELYDTSSKEDES